ncbi:glycosyltransferase family 2 protein [Desertivirga xinjiangensis]|uniref:glycosyltransferase family 2 protein n=1 Tax=Desertivirga xinjiangensis TaxID=539206 RepID=UPI00210B0C13|nr:glycosyltransferase family 2 protein [Pedobacter xinjiangensis]
MPLIQKGDAVVRKAPPLISIIIVTYNASAFLKDCLDSVEKLSSVDFELLIFDGQSQDNTVSIIKEYDKIVNYWQSEPDKGIYDAMNKAVGKARGRWFFFLGADDQLLPGFSEMTSKLKNDRTLYYGDCNTTEGLCGSEYSAYKLAKRNLCQQAIFYPKVVFEKYKFNLRYPVFADYLLNIQCWGDESLYRQYEPIAVSFYNLNGFSSKQNEDPFKLEKALHIKKHLSWFVYIRYLIRRSKEAKKTGSNFF